MEAISRLLPEGLPVSVVLVAATLLLTVAYTFLAQERPLSGFPLASIPGKSPRSSWLTQGREVIFQGLKKYSGPFQVMTGTGPKIILPNRFADELRNHPSLDFNKAFAKDFFTSYPGFDGHRLGLSNDRLVQEVVRTKLTPSLGLITEDLVEESKDSIHDIFGDKPEWTTSLIREDIANVVARLSSRVFLGKDLCRNQRWIAISKTYTIDSFIVSFIMRAAPPFLRPLAYWVNPKSKNLRNAVRDARQMITPELQKRQAAVDAAKAEGRKPPKVADTLGWMYDIMKGRMDVDYVGGQLSLTMAAIHTTTESTCAALIDLCQHPEAADEMRKEIIDVLSKEGWAKTSLYKLRLMDSFLKEGQRLRPMGSASMNRFVSSPIELSDGTVLPKGSRIMVAGNYMDPEIFPDPEKFDAHRFMRMREEPGQENSWQLATTTPSHFFFGYGTHACPGRFFAVNEIKIALCHFLLKYEWRYIPGEGRPAPRLFENGHSVDASSKIQYRSRTPEIDLDNLVC